MIIICFFNLFLDNVFKYTPLQRVKPAILKKYFKNHPDKELITYLINGFTNGFKLGLTREPKTSKKCRNSKNVRNNLDVTQRLVDKEVGKGHILGPFTEPPIKGLFISPLNIVPKPNCEIGWRLIHDLAFPYDDNGVNACIPRENAKVTYHTLDEVIEMALEIGPDAKGARIDIRSAFRNLPIHFSDLKYLGFMLNGYYYINCCLPFGASSSCLLFEKVASAVQWIVQNETNCKWISHFLDDFPMLERGRKRLKQLMLRFTCIVEEIGLPIAHDKTLGPTSDLEYLGLVLDFRNQRIIIPDKKRQKCLALIAAVRARKRSPSGKIQVRKLQQLAGCLNFLCQALPEGKCFLMSTYKTIRAPIGKQIKSHHNRGISAELDEDLCVFEEFLSEMHIGHTNSVPFLNRLEIYHDTIELYADAAGSSMLGMGCVFGNKWFFGGWNETSLFTPLQYAPGSNELKQLTENKKENPAIDFIPNICILELLAITAAFQLWAPELSGRTIILRSDSSACVGMINSKRTEIRACTYLVKLIAKLCLQFQIVVRAKHVSGEDNVAADLVSRRQVVLLRTKPEGANLDRHPMPPPPVWPPVWSAQEMLKF